MSTRSPSPTSPPTSVPQRTGSRVSGTGQHRCAPYFLLPHQPLTAFHVVAGGTTAGGRAKKKKKIPGAAAGVRQLRFLTDLRHDFPRSSSSRIPAIFPFDTTNFQSSDPPSAAGVDPPPTHSVAKESPQELASPRAVSEQPTLAHSSLNGTPTTF
jgi:hypothetical protein